MTETELTKEIKSGSARAFDEMVAAYKDMVVNTCYGFLRDRHDAEDIAQDVFLEVHRSIHTFQEKSKLSSWLYRIAVNKSLNLAKKKKRRQLMSSLQARFGGEESPAEIPDTNMPNPQADLEQAERVQILQRAIDSLAENQRIAFTLSKYEQLSYKEIAEVMATTLPAVESLMNRAKMNLQKKLRKYYENG